MTGKRSPFRFGDKIRRARETKKLTLKSVAQKAGVSESLISQIERNKVSPAIDTLLSLADALDIDLEYLFEEYRRERAVTIIRAGERRKIVENGITFEQVVQSDKCGAGEALEAYVLTLPPGAKTQRGAYGHYGREIGIIMDGEASFTYNGAEDELRKGDAVAFSAADPHVLQNKTDRELRALWIITPPRFSGDR